MTLLILGVVLWWAAHLFKRVTPGARAAMGDKGKGLVAAAIVVSIVLMVIGYRGADGAIFWGRSSAMVGINNLLMLVALYMMSPAPKKGVLLAGMRHPMLMGFAIFCLAHLLVNGDVESFILFGGLGVWALATMQIINSAEPAWTPGPKGTIAKDGMFLVASVVLMAVIGFIHGLVGPVPFGG
ncbi:MAG: NnrU family protein [Paracoccaceae bacterium]